MQDLRKESERLFTLYKTKESVLQHLNIQFSIKRQTVYSHTLNTKLINFITNEKGDN